MNKAELDLKGINHRGCCDEKIPTKLSTDKKLFMKSDNTDWFHVNSSFEFMQHI